MATHDITIDDGSPLITYTGEWNDSTNEDIVSQYWLNTYHSTSQVGAAATFSFTGTAVYIYGSKRPSHGTFDVDVDGASIGQFDGTSATIENMQLLAEAKGLKWGEHTVTITNSDPLGNFLDIDMIKWTTGKAGLSSITNSTQIDDADTSGAVKYSPSGSWANTDATVAEGSYLGGTVHSSSTLGSSVAVRFKGNAVYVFGSTDSSSGRFDAQVDQQTAVSLVGTTSTFRQPALLYYGDGFADGEHTLTLTNQEEGTSLRFDYLVASTWAAGASSSNSADSSAGTVAATTNQELHKSNNAAVIGGAIGGVVGLLLLVLFALCCLRLRRAATMDESRSDTKIVSEDGITEGQVRPRPLSHFSWRPRSQVRPISTISGVSGVSGPGMAGIGAHRVTGAVTGAITGWAYKRRSAQQADLTEKAYPSNTLQVPQR
ncbi:transmembrane protein [Ceratobasidium sp. AG-Ba]|nr:transmembrane protein [Ceratobasidium sp. AG-Ba]